MAREDLPRLLAPMLLTAGPVPDGDGWACEVKWDGARAQVALNGRVCIRLRPGRDCTDQFPDLAALAGVDERLLLDGELVCLDGDGKPDFAAVRRRLAAHGRAIAAAAGRDPVTLIIFDVLHHAGEAVRVRPHRERRQLLDTLALQGPTWRPPVHRVGELQEFAQVTRDHGLEGIVCKRLDSPWMEGKRSADWVKTKHRRRQTLRVTGWIPGEDGQPDEYLLARGPAPAGSIAFGLAVEQRAALRAAVTERERPPRRRSRVRWIDDGVPHEAS